MKKNWSIETYEEKNEIDFNNDNYSFNNKRIHIFQR